MVYVTDDQERLFKGHTGQIFVLLTVLLLCLQLARRLLPPLLPTIIDDFGITAFSAGVALTLLRISRASMEYPSGRFADQLSRTTVLVVCLGVIIIGLSILSLAISYWIFILGVVVFGLGSGLYSPASRALLSDIFREKRGRAFGIHMMGSDLSGILAAGIGVLIVSIATWRGAFLPLATVLVALLIAFYLLSRETFKIESVEFGLQKTGIRLFGDPSLRWIVLVYSLYVVASSGFISFLPTFLIEVHGASFELASSAFALVYGVGAIAKPVSGFLSDSIPRTSVAGGNLIVAVSGLVLLVIAPVTGVALGGVFLYAIGQRGVPPALQAFLMDRFPDESMGGDLGAMRTIYMTIGSFGPALTGFIASRFGFVPAYTSLILFFLSGGLILIWFSVFGWPKSSR